jgi:ABC-2 type transport system ATP-binding protein
MKRKIALCAALIHKPSLLILDEPFANLDPVSSDLLCQFLLKYKQAGHVVILSSHDLMYVDKIGTHLGVLDQQKLAYSGTMEEFKISNQGTIDEALLQMFKRDQNVKDEFLNKIVN